MQVKKLGRRAKIKDEGIIKTGQEVIEGMQSLKEDKSKKIETKKEEKEKIEINEEIKETEKKKKTTKKIKKAKLEKSEKSKTKKVKKVSKYKIYKEPNKSETETTINVLYGEKLLSIYTNKVTLQRKLNKVIGEPKREYIKGRSITGSTWEIPLSEKQMITKVMLKANIFEL